MRMLRGEWGEIEKDLLEGNSRWEERGMVGSHFRFGFISCKHCCFVHLLCCGVTQLYILFFKAKKYIYKRLFFKGNFLDSNMKSKLSTSWTERILFSAVFLNTHLFFFNLVHVHLDCTVPLFLWNRLVA